MGLKSLPSHVKMDTEIGTAAFDWAVSPSIGWELTACSTGGQLFSLVVQQQGSKCQRDHAKCEKLTPCYRHWTSPPLI